MNDFLEILCKVQIIIDEFYASGIACYLWGKKGHTPFLTALSHIKGSFKVIDENNVKIENYGKQTVIIENIYSIPFLQRLKLQSRFPDIVFFDPYFDMRSLKSFKLYKNCILENYTFHEILKSYLFACTTENAYEKISSKARLSIARFGRSKEYSRIAACGSYFTTGLAEKFAIMAGSICEKKENILFDWYGKTADNDCINAINEINKKGFNRRIRFWSDAVRVWALAKDAKMLILFGDMPFCRRVVVGAIENKIPLLWLTDNFLTTPLEMLEKADVLRLPFNTDISEINNFLLFALEKTSEVELQVAYKEFLNTK
jgi:hypothetical protein